MVMILSFLQVPFPFKRASVSCSSHFEAEMQLKDISSSMKNCDVMDAHFHALPISKNLDKPLAIGVAMGHLATRLQCSIYEHLLADAFVVRLGGYMTCLL